MIQIAAEMVDMDIVPCVCPLVTGKTVPKEAVGMNQRLKRMSCKNWEGTWNSQCRFLMGRFSCVDGSCIILCAGTNMGNLDGIMVVSDIGGIKNGDTE